MSVKKFGLSAISSRAITQIIAHIGELAYGSVETSSNKNLFLTFSTFCTLLEVPRKLSLCNA
jgi:hypothetical protein